MGLDSSKTESAVNEAMTLDLSKVVSDQRTKIKQARGHDRNARWRACMRGEAYFCLDFLVTFSSRKK